MRYLTTASIIFLSFFSVIASTYAEYGEKPYIISREEWGADEEFWSRESTYWQDILERRSQASSTPQSQETIDYIAEKNAKINNYLNENFSKYFTLDETVYYNTQLSSSYAWPLKYTNFVDSIIVHHTESEYDNSLIWIQDVYQFHSLSRQWGDLGYNYVIW